MAPANVPVALLCMAVALARDIRDHGRRIDLGNRSRAQSSSQLRITAMVGEATDSFVANHLRADNRGGGRGSTSEWSADLSRPAREPW